MASKWIQSLSVQVDDNGLPMFEAWLQQILAKQPAGPALESGNLAIIAASLGAKVLAGPKTVTVPSTAGGTSLATLLGTALSANLKRLVLVTAGTIAWNYGATTGSEIPLLAGGQSMPYDFTGANVLRFQGVGGSVAMSVTQIG